MSRAKTFIKGTFILTATGILTRIMGFFYRIFLSRTFHAEGVGLYQLIFPVYALCFSLTCAGIEVALSRLVANRAALHRRDEALRFLKAALALTVSFSLIAMLVLQRFSGEIALLFLNEPRSRELLVAMSYAFPFAAIHSCIIGYHLGLKETKEPAVSQLIEQLARISSVWFFYQIGLHRAASTGVIVAIFGLVCGEMFSAAYSLLSLRKELFTVGSDGIRASTGALRQSRRSNTENFRVWLAAAGELLRFSAPLTTNRVLLNLLQSVEAVSIPARLQAHGLTLTQSLSVYGILTGIALPCILFPSAITNSISTMMLPAVAEIQASDSRRELRKLVSHVTLTCLTLGFACQICFFLSADLIGSSIFHSPDAGKFIRTLSFICPFMYTNTSLISILNGLGRTTTSFLVNMSGLLVRIASIWFLIPIYGILGYLWGLLGSQLLVTVLGFIEIKIHGSFT